MVLFTHKYAIGSFLTSSAKELLLGYNVSQFQPRLIMFKHLLTSSKCTPTIKVQ